MKKTCLLETQNDSRTLNPLSCYRYNYYHQLLSLPSPSNFRAPYNISFLYLIVSLYLEFSMPYHLNFYIITSPVS